MSNELVSVRYMVDDVAAALDFYTTNFGFEPGVVAAPAFADVTRGNLRLLLSGPQSSAGRPMTDGATPGPGGWNRIHLVVDDIDAEVARLDAAGVRFRNQMVSGPGGRQILVVDPSGNLVELFQAASAYARRVVVTEGSDDPSRLARRLGLGDAVIIGLGSMIGAGIFSAFGPAAEAAGSGLLIGLAIAAVVAYCNATSSASLAARYPASGGTYVYGRERLGPFWGHLAGWGFVVGKTASCAAIALTVGAYAAPAWSRPIALVSVVAVTAVDLRGVHRTVAATRVIVVLVLVALALVVVAALFGGTASRAHIGAVATGDPHGVLESAGLLFFAFAGYARIATLGEEVREPSRTIPKAIPRALGITLLVYAAVAVSALAAVGPAALADSSAPLATVVRAGSLAALAPAVRVGATVAALGVLLSLIAGVGRTTFAMASDGALPRWLAAVHTEHAVPHHAELAIGAIVAVLVLVTDLRHAIGFSSFCVLAYYAIANASAWTLPRHARRSRVVAGAGLCGCVVLACTLPITSVVSGVAVLVAGVLARLLTTHTAHRSS